MFIITALRMSNLTKIKYKIDGPGGGVSNIISVPLNKLLMEHKFLGNTRKLPCDDRNFGVRE
jgi:hypothetical protein